MVSTTGTIIGSEELFNWSRYLGCRVHLCRINVEGPLHGWWKWYGTTQHDLYRVRNSNWKRLACKNSSLSFSLSTMVSSSLNVWYIQGFTTLSSSVQFEQKPRSDLSLLFSAASPSALSLLTSLLTYDPRRRLNSLQSLQHPYFVNAPYPTKPERLPKPSKMEREQTVEEVGMPMDKDERKKRRRNGDGLDEVPGAKKVARRLDFSWEIDAFRFWFVRAFYCCKDFRAVLLRD